MFVFIFVGASRAYGLLEFPPGKFEFSVSFCSEKGLARMQAVLEALKDKDVRIFNILDADKCNDMETFLSLNNDDLVRLKLTTKMIRTIQELQKQCENELPVEEIFINEQVAPPAPTDPPAPSDESGPTEENIFYGIIVTRTINEH